MNALLLILVSITSFLSISISAKHKWCNATICEVLTKLEQDSYQTKTFEGNLDVFAIENDLRTGHTALRKMLANLGKEVIIKDDMPLQAYLIQYQKILQEQIVKTLSTIVVKTAQNSLKLKELLDNQEKHTVQLKSIEKMMFANKNNLDKATREKELELELELRNLSCDDHVCPSGWVNNLKSNECFYFGKPDENMNFFEAKQYCKDIGGTLASVSSKQENDFIISKSRAQYSWLGLNDVEMTGKLSWTDGSQTNYRNYAEGEPSNSGNNKCVIIKGDQTGVNNWNKWSCKDKRPSVLCKRKTEILPRKQCPPGWKQYEDDCFWLQTKAETYQKANIKCQLLGFGSSIVLPKDKEQSSYIWDMVGQSHAWLGMDDLKNEGSFVKYDNTIPLFTNWAINQPDNYGYYEHCSMIRKCGLWNDYPCDRKLKYVCQTSAKIPCINEIDCD